MFVLSHAEARKRAAEAVLSAPDGRVVRIGENTRNLDQNVPQNVEGPAELCPKPAPGFEFDARGVLVQQSDKDDMTKEYEIYERWTK